MSARSAFFGVLLTLALCTMVIGMTFIFKDKTKEAMEVFGGGLFAGIAILIFGLPLIWELD